MAKTIRFRMVGGKLEADAIGFQGKGCEQALRDTAALLGSTVVEGSEQRKPEYNLGEQQEGERVAQ